MTGADVRVGNYRYLLNQQTLFKTYKDAEDYIEKSDLALWLGCISVGKAEKYSLEQLRKVKEILDN